MKPRFSSTKYLPAFQSFLETRAAEGRAPGIDIYDVLFGVAAGAAALFFNQPWFLVAPAATFGFWMVRAAFGFRKRRENLPSRAILLALAKYREVEPHRLPKRLDRSAATLLEAAATYWLQIRMTLQLPNWTRGGSTSFRQHRSDILASADGIMNEIALHCADCIGEPSESRKSDLKKAFEELAELDIEDALESFRDVIKGNNDKYQYKSPHLPLIFETVRSHAEQLKLLAAEVQAIQRTAEMPLSERTASDTKLPDFDSLIHNLRATRAAESELGPSDVLREEL